MTKIVVQHFQRLHYTILQGQWAWKNDLKGRCACEFGYSFAEDHCKRTLVDTNTIGIIIAVFVAVGFLFGCCMVFWVVRCICNAAKELKEINKEIKYEVDNPNPFKLAVGDHALKLQSKESTSHWIGYPGTDSDKSLNKPNQFSAIC